MYCSYSIGGNQIYNPESARIASSRCAMATATVTVPASGSCAVTNPQSNSQPSFTPSNRVQIPVLPGSAPPAVNVGTTPASLTMLQAARTVLSQESNPYNPDTRFRQYFPTPPIPYQCPERIPNNFPKSSTKPCLPIQRFQGSSKKENSLNR